MPTKAQKIAAAAVLDKYFSLDDPSPMQKERQAYFQQRCGKEAELQQCAWDPYFAHLGLRVRLRTRGFWSMGVDPEKSNFEFRNFQPVRRGGILAGLNRTAPKNTGVIFILKV